MTTAFVHHSTSVHRQLSVCTYIYTGSRCIYVRDILPLGELITDRLLLALKSKDYGMPTYVAVLGRGTSVFRSLEDHSFRETVGRYRIDSGCEPR